MHLRLRSSSACCIKITAQVLCICIVVDEVGPGYSASGNVLVVNQAYNTPYKINTRDRYTYTRVVLLYPKTLPFC